RLADAAWWRRAMRKNWTREAESAVRLLGLVRRGREPYASDQAIVFCLAMEVRAREFLHRHELVNESGEQLQLFDIAARSLANPRLRRGELMVRMRGFEEIAQDLSHGGDFYTLTCPSRFHPQGRDQSGNPIDNPRYDELSVREAQA